MVKVILHFFFRFVLIRKCTTRNKMFGAKPTAAFSFGTSNGMNILIFLDSCLISLAKCLLRGVVYLFNKVIEV